MSLFAVDDVEVRCREIDRSDVRRVRRGVDDARDLVVPERPPEGLVEILSEPGRLRIEREEVVDERAVARREIDLRLIVARELAMLCAMTNAASSEASKKTSIALAEFSAMG